MNVRIILGDAGDVLRDLEHESIDALVTDPPAGIGFMGHAWDGAKGGRDAWVAWLARIAGRCIVAMKPGAHGLVWALPRTSHWTAAALENAGFEVRDVIMHVFGSGFPKSLNLPDGIGTALKPAAEHWILVRKPLVGTVAENVERYGTGGINVEGCRVGTNRDKHGACLGHPDRSGTALGLTYHGPAYSAGRWPPHLLLSHSPGCADRCVEGCPVRMMDEQSGYLATGRLDPHHTIKAKLSQVAKGAERERSGFQSVGDSGGASRYFPRFRYQPKPSRAEREAGCGHLPTRTGAEAVGREEGSAGAGRTAGRVHNHHPTLKSLDLIRWLVRLITPPGGTVLDPFMGSGTTGCACACEGFGFVGIEQDPEYVQIARARIEHYSARLCEIENDDRPRPEKRQQTLF